MPCRSRPACIWRIERECSDRARPEHQDGEGDEDGGGGPGERAEPAAVAVAAHQPLVLREQQHEDEDEGQEHAVGGLREQHDLQERHAGQEHEAGAEHDHRLVEHVELRRVVAALVDAALPAEGLADVVAGGKGQDAGGEERRVEEAEGEQRARPFSRERAQGHRRVRRRLDVAAGPVDGRGARQHDEERHHVGDDAAEDHVEARERIVVEAHAFFHDGRLEIELHPGRDGGAHQRHHHGERRAGQGQRGPQGAARHLAPVRLRQDARHQVGDVEDAGHQEDALDDLRRALEDEQPDGERHQRHRVPAGDAEDLQRLRHSGELRHGVAHVGDDQGEHDVEGGLDPEPLADEIGEALAGDHAHARGHLLHQDQRQGDGDQRPEERIAEVGARLRVGGDAAGVVVHVGGDDSRSHHREHRDDARPAGLEQPGGRGAEAGRRSIGIRTRLHVSHGGPFPGRRPRSPRRGSSPPSPPAGKRGCTSPPAPPRGRRGRRAQAAPGARA